MTGPTRGEAHQRRRSNIRNRQCAAGLGYMLYFPEVHVKVRSANGPVACPMRELCARIPTLRWAKIRTLSAGL